MPEVAPGGGLRGGGPVERVLAAVALVPPGRVVSYGDVGALTGVGPRRVGAILREHGASVPWWRVVSHDGVLVPLAAARRHWAAEGIEVRADGRGCRVRVYRADIAGLASEYRFVAAERGWGMVDPSTN